MANAWLQAITEAISEKADKVPPGWQTTPEVAAEMGKSLPRARAILGELVKTGAAEVRSFTIITGSSGNLHSVPHYRIKPAKKSSRV